MARQSEPANVPTALDCVGTSLHCFIAVPIYGTLHQGECGASALHISLRLALKPNLAVRFALAVKTQIWHLHSRTPNHGAIVEPIA